MKAPEILAEISQQVSVCEKCALHYSRKRAVPGEGPSDATVMFIGEGPGFYENEQGRPFVGASGKYLEELLDLANLSRAKVFITNVVKCRPPGNRDPLPEELEACSSYLDRQIDTINPKVIVTLGRYSMARFFPQARISDVHGKASWVRGRLIVAMYHPAAALHQPSLKSSLEADFKRLRGYIEQAKKAQPEIKPAADDDSPKPSKADDPTQLSLF